MWRAATLGAAALTSVTYVLLGGVAMALPLATPSALAWLVLSGPPMVVAAAFLLWRRPDNPIGGLLMVTALGTTVLPTILEIPTVLRYESAGPEPWMWAPIWAAQTLGIIGAIAAAAMLALLPDGRLSVRLRRWWLPAALGLALLPTAGLLTSETLTTHVFQFPGVAGISSPIYVAALGPVGPLVTVGTYLSYLVIVAGIAALLIRYRRTSRREQRQLRWVLLAGIVAIAAGIVPAALAQSGFVPVFVHDVSAWVTGLPTVLLSVAVVAAVVEPRWVDVDQVIRRSVVYGTLSLLILAVYIAGAAAVGVTAGAELPLELAILLTVIVAVLLQPIRSRLHGLADQWVFGAPPTRYGALADFGSTVEGATDPSEIVSHLADTAHRALRLRWATATVDGMGSRTVGERTGRPAVVLDVRHRGSVFGRLECGAPIDGDLDPAGITVLGALAGQAGLAIANARLATRIVEAQEEERRRIERNLHDGAQQALVALIARLGVARSRVEAGTLDAAAVDDLRASARQILSDVRELAQGIHPSIVADGGILAAVEERCSSLPLEVTVEAPRELRCQRFAAQIEGAAYFLVAEALANILKHARATHATVTLARRDRRLSLTVVDDGAGFDPASTERHGLAGLEDRFAALGGVVHVTSRPGAGTRVTASLPVEP
jgi:signal transduction histidine kinase